MRPAPTPPRLARWVLRLARLGRHRREIEADLAHLFAIRVARSGPDAARRRYWRDVLSFAGVRLGTPVIESPSRGSGMDAWLHDLRLTFRRLCRQPAFLTTACLTLALGLGANVAVLTVVETLFAMSPPHVVEPDRVRRLHVDVPQTGGGRFVWWQTPYAMYRALARDLTTVESIAAYRQSSGSMGVGHNARPVSVVFADGSYFGLFGTQPALGRFFAPAETTMPDGAPVAVLADALWRGAFGGDPAIVGRDVRLGARTYQVVGVAPAGFAGDLLEPADVWLPLPAAAPDLAPSWATSTTERTVNVVVRLGVGATWTQAASEALPIVQAAGTGPATEPTTRVLFDALGAGVQADGELTALGRVALWLEGVSLLVLIVAVASVVNLQITRAVARRQEMAIAVALGVGRFRRLRQAVLESTAVAVLGGMLAVLTAALTLAALQPVLASAAGTLAIGGRVLAATAAAVCITAMLSAVSIAAYGRSGSLSALRAGRGEATSGRRSRVRGGLVILQVAVSLVLIVGAGLFLRSLDRLDALEYGIDIDRVITVSLPLRQAGFTPDAIRNFYAEAIDEIASIPGIDGVSTGVTTPFAPSLGAPVAVPGVEPERLQGPGFPTFYAVGAGYLRTMGTPILRGREFSPGDTATSAPVMLIEAALGEHLWPGEDPIGRCIKVGGPAEPCREIVGVTASTRRFVATPRFALRYYLPLAQMADSVPQALFVRPAGDPAAAIPAIRAALARAGADLPFAQIRVLRELATPETRQWRLGASLFTTFGTIALLVAGFGVYGLLSAIVAQRTREMGVRLALGSSGAALVAVVLRQSIARVALGVVLGIVMAGAGATFMEPLLFETPGWDAATFAIAPVLLLAIAVAASLVPAWRASRIDPTIVLRGD